MVDEFDWANATLALYHNASGDIRSLVESAGLSAEGGDLSNIDLRNIDLSGQDLSGWDLSHAQLNNSRLAGADLKGAKLDISHLIQAIDWEQAQLDESTFSAAKTEVILQKSLAYLGMPGYIIARLNALGVNNVSDFLKLNAKTLYSVHISNQRVYSRIRSRLLENGLLTIGFEHALKEAQALTQSEHIAEIKIITQSRLSMINKKADQSKKLALGDVLTFEASSPAATKRRKSTQKTPE